MSAADIIEQCWRNGNSISETIPIVRTHTGHTPTFEDVRRQFAALSNEDGTLAQAMRDLATGISITKAGVRVDPIDFFHSPESAEQQDERA